MGLKENIFKLIKVIFQIPWGNTTVHALTSISLKWKPIWQFLLPWLLFNNVITGSSHWCQDKRNEGRLRKKQNCTYLYMTVCLEDTKESVDKLLE